MKNNKFYISILASLGSVLLLASCGPTNTKSQHECAFYPVEAKEATCITVGNIAYDQCIYCKKIEVNGVEKSEADVLTPINPNHHEHLIDHPANEATCISTGNKAYSYCSDCEKYIVDGEIKDNADSVLLPIDENAHQLTTISAKAPDCWHGGYKEHQECSVCHNTFIDGVKVEEESLFLPATGEHTYDANGSCSVCKLAYKYDEKEFVKENYYSFTNCSKGVSFVDTEMKEQVANALISERMTFNSQLSYSATAGSSTLSHTDEELVITHTNASSNTNYSFTRIAPGVKQADGSVSTYVGKFLFSFDVTVDTSAYIQRVGAMLVDNGFTVIEGTGISQSLLIGKGTHKTCENRADREFEPGATYRFIYSMETTDAKQLIQLFACSAPTTIHISNLHLIPLSDASNVVNSSLLYFGKADMSKNVKDGESSTPDPEPEPEPEPTPTKKTYLMPNGANFFDAANWLKPTTSGDGASVGDGIYETDGSLSFTNETTSRISLFHVNDGNDNMIHPADNAKNKDLTSLYNNVFTYSMDLTVNGEFDMGILGAAKANGKSTKNQGSFYLTFGTDGSIKMSQTANPTTMQYENAFVSETGLYTQNTKFNFTIKMNRVDAGNLTLQFFINNEPIKFTGDSVTVTEETPYAYGFNDAGVYTLSNFLSTNGMGQRFGVFPIEGSKVTISSLEINRTANL